MNNKLNLLKDKIKSLKAVAVAYSGGVDSTFLLKVAHDVLRGSAVAVTVISPLIPSREMAETDEFCRKEGIRHIKITVDPFEIEGFKENGKNRCYICKKHIFTRIKEEMEEEGIQNILEGSNLDDTTDYRPGMVAVREIGVKSPLLDASLTKSEIRELSKEMGLTTWNKPSFACLASRFAYGEEITSQKLIMVEKAEEYLSDMGFEQYRVRIHGSMARIELVSEDFEKALKNKDSINTYLKSLGFTYVTLDLGGYRRGSMNDTITQ